MYCYLTKNKLPPPLTSTTTHLACWPLILQASWMSSGISFTHLTWMTHRLVSSKGPTRYDSSLLKCWNSMALEKQIILHHRHKQSNGINQKSQTENHNVYYFKSNQMAWAMFCITDFFKSRASLWNGDFLIKKMKYNLEPRLQPPHPHVISQNLEFSVFLLSIICNLPTIIMFWSWVLYSSRLVPIKKHGKFKVLGDFKEGEFKLGSVFLFYSFYRTRWCNCFKSNVFVLHLVFCYDKLVVRTNSVAFS